MRRTLVLVVGALVLVACSREHGAAPKGTFAPGGPIDNRGNAATSRALGEERPLGSAEAPAAYVDVEEAQPWQLYERYDAGGAQLDPSASALEEVSGRVVGVSEDQLRIQPEQGQPISLRLESPSQVTLGGSLMAPDQLEQGAEVRASFVVEEGQPVANDVAVLSTPGEGFGLRDPQLAPGGEAARPDGQTGSAEPPAPPAR
ncbi:hypothetical protein [Vulgatibacter sp.]|uniref:hypothetical protein n=1 Tax=Vulgatibacter sp. TaxID=1971226 RepID=UPI0035617723